LKLLEGPKICSNGTFLSKGIKKDLLFVLDIMQVTFVKEPIVDLPTPGFNSQGMGTQTKTPPPSNKGGGTPARIRRDLK